MGRLAAHIRIGLLLLLLAAGVSRLAAAPLRVALPPVYSLESATDDARLLPVLNLYLRERLAECPGVLLAGGDRSAAVFAELTSGVRTADPAQMLAAFSEYLPVDALVTFALQPNALRVAVYREKQPAIHEIPLPAVYELAPVVYQAAGIIGKDLGLPAEEQAILTKDRIGNPTVFTAYFIVQLLSARWPQNAGESRLKYLQPLFAKYQGHPALAAQNLLSANLLYEQRNRDQAYADRGLKTATLSLASVLGTPYEEAADAIVQRQPAAFEDELLAICRRLTGIDVDDLVKDIETDAPDAGLDPAGQKTASTVKAQVGAVRLLGLIRSARALPVLVDLARHADPRVREAAAGALRHYDKNNGLAALTTLCSDKTPEVAFAARKSLWQRGGQTDGLPEAARKMAAHREARHRLSAYLVLDALGTADDATLFRQGYRDADPAIRRHAFAGLLRVGAGTDDLLAAFNDPEGDLVRAALQAVPPAIGKQLIPRLQSLANDPIGTIAEAARLALQPFRPAEARAQLAFDLAGEHPYRRMRLLDGLAKSPQPWVPDELAAACANRDAHTRAYALARLTARAPERARPLLLRAIRDPYGWVRLHAAALLAALAAPEMAAPLRQAIAAETDAATGRYLQDALAKAEDKPAPAALPAARSIAGGKNLSWLCGMGTDAAHSPFDAYYMLNVEVTDTWKQAYQAGKIVYGRVGTVGNPGAIAIGQQAADQFWLYIDGQLTAKNLPYLDGLIFGEETMNMQTDALWPKGWRLFCLDAGIDPQTVQGDRKNLNVYEQRAWQYWALQREIDGFNELYDYVHLKYDKLRPGIQVGTFLTEQSLLQVGSNPGDFRWKFDVGGIYDYKGCTRLAAYSLVRRIKTIWPERPILWLSLGLGGAEMNPVKRSQTVPVSPLTTRANRAWADALTAYMAGADTGWFSIWIFVANDWKGNAMNLSGAWCHLEDIVPGTESFEKAVAYAWRGAEEDYERPKTAPLPDEILPEEDFAFDETAPASPEERKRRVAADTERFRRGFRLYQQYVYNCARIFSGLPRQAEKPPALVIRPGISVWTRPETANPLAPGMELLNAYDFLCDINETPQLDLARYRMLAVHNPGPLRDDTIAALSRWLRDTPGVLYVHQGISSDNAAEASTPADHDGQLQNDWPWEADVTITPAPAGGKPGPLALTGPDGEHRIK